jgi:hypothetical protein
MLDQGTINTIAAQLQPGDKISWRRRNGKGLLYKEEGAISPQLAELTLSAGEAMSSVGNLAKAAKCKVRFLAAEVTKDIYELHE